MSDHECSLHDEQKYKGVRKRKWGKWVCEIRLPNSRERIWLGSYDCPKKAAKAFDAAAYCLRGNSAKLNFPDQPPNIPGGRTFSPSRIQAAAAQFANSHQICSHQCSETPSSRSVSDTVPTETYASTSSNYMVYDDTNNVRDYGIFPGFDDYFMRPPPIESPRYSEYEEDNSSDFSQDLSYNLWNF
ncbi:ethylene-responsive transcription factor ERF017-like [Rutidosis leptorrhynchoides]|uniref:ethylene-responsive transcription factor ERF017-like n=1 Tax=Rutidosis leptorrhynchoides TaxID=125765 RepID=UPI003A9A33E2